MAGEGYGNLLGGVDWEAVEEAETEAEGTVEQEEEEELGAVEGVGFIETTEEVPRGGNGETRALGVYDGRTETGNDDDYENVKVGEEVEVGVLGGGSIEGVIAEMEAKGEELSGEMENLEACWLAEMTEEEDDNERGGDNEADAFIKQDDNNDEIKGQNEGFIVDFRNLDGGGSQMVEDDEISGKELCREAIDEIHGKEPSHKIDDHSLSLDGKAGSKVEDDPALMGDETEAGSPLVAYYKDAGREEMSEEEIDVFRISSNIESREEEEFALMDEIVMTALADDDDKDADVEEESREMDNSPLAASQDELDGKDEGPVGVSEMEAEGVTEADASKNGTGGKRKRGRKPMVPVKTSEIIAEEDVCFVCLDGGDLVLCDRRGCPKAYHPSCVDRDEAFFQSKGSWNCGWHLCSKCEKNTYYKCCTCAFSLCKGCIKDAVIFCLRGNIGLCEACMKTMILIENNDQGNEKMVAFDDKSQWEYLFKDYLIEQKEKFSFTAEEIVQAKYPGKEFDVDFKQETQAASGDLFGNVEAIKYKRKKTKKQKKSSSNEGGSDIDINPEKQDGNHAQRKAKRWLTHSSKELYSDDLNSAEEKTVKRGKNVKMLTKSLANKCSLVNQIAKREVASHADHGWASRELLEFVMHMKNGDRSVLSQLMYKNFCYNTLSEINFVILDVKVK